MRIAADGDRGADRSGTTGFASATPSSMSPRDNVPNEASHPFVSESVVAPPLTTNFPSQRGVNGSRQNYLIRQRTRPRLAYAGFLY